MDLVKRKLRPFFSLTRRQKRNIRICLSTVVMALAFYRILYYKQDETQRKLILVYTPYPSEPWGPRNAEESKNYKFTDWDGTPCEENRCQITFDKSLRNFSDAVLVHVGHPNFNIDEAKSNRPPAQRWVLYTKESPGVYPIGDMADGVYNWTATYRLDSDFFVPYGSYSPLKIPNKSDNDDLTEQPGENVNYAKGKDKMATFGVSNHCNERGVRFSYVRALLKHIPISLYGKCAPMFESNNTWKCPRRKGQIDDDCEEEIQRHKFYLAFENSLCIDYITEKYWRNSLERGLVPVVLGGAQYGPDLVIPGSFINAADFDSVKDLADYLKYLDKNDTAYNQYFQWKTKYKVVKYNFWLCQLCKALHDPTKPAKIYHKMSEFLGIKGACKVNEERVWNIINRG
ncbi:galactoside 3(4)-L-fucosyltransferase-like [Orbicella faveolata]|uniref:galactoside 3(4)-L-fucosyltransferase-like n=1 Tax=Orbicella faveolata TaxID=48498 RepID=UPI0009E4553C|nr:galactoside 3(4)-L-fucosyltransferase-like [Orbicella faveolata]